MVRGQGLGHQEGRLEEEQGQRPEQSGTQPVTEQVKQAEPSKGDSRGAGEKLREWGKFPERGRHPLQQLWQGGQAEQRSVAARVETVCDVIR